MYGWEGASKYMRSQLLLKNNIRNPIRLCVKLRLLLLKLQTSLCMRFSVLYATPMRKCYCASPNASHQMATVCVPAQFFTIAKGNCYCADPIMLHQRVTVTVTAKFCVPHQRVTVTVLAKCLVPHQRVTEYQLNASCHTKE